jgi:hypothetical protein
MGASYHVSLRLFVSLQSARVKNCMHVMNGYRIYGVSIAYNTGEKEQSRLYTLEIHVVNGTHRLARERR